MSDWWALEHTTLAKILVTMYDNFDSETSTRLNDCYVSLNIVYYPSYLDQHALSLLSIYN